MIITVIAIIKDFIVSKEINYVYMAPSQNRFVLPNLPIAVNLSKYEKTLCFFTLFESDFVNMTLGDYSWVKIANSKTLLFIVASGIILIEHKILDSKKETTKVAILKIWPVYYISSIQILLQT